MYALGAGMKRLIFLIVFIILTLAGLFLLTVRPAFSFSLKAFPAKACILVDENGMILAQKNSRTRLPPASTVKLMTAMVALDHLNADMVVKVGSRAASARSVPPKLQAGDELTVSDLLHLALIKSNNSAAVALAEAAAGSEVRFAELMNRKAQEIGARDTRFTNASGLPKGRQYTTVRDLTIMLKKALGYPLIQQIIGKKEQVIKTAAGRELFLENTDDLLWLRSNIVGGKTGFTNSARHCFVGALDTERGRMFTAVLGAPSRSGLWKSATMLADFGSAPPQVNKVAKSAVAKPGYGFMRATVVELTR
jgi:serine-type D-Ala-D-Ala carboxypeptidase (penicillin-binding protein 5/6)